MDTYEARLSKALVAQHRQWFDYETKAIKPEFAEHISCPACGSDDMSPYMEKDFFTFNRCNLCTMVYLSPRLTVPATYALYNSDWSAIYNERKFYGGDTARDDGINQENVNLISAHVGVKSPKLLEIGFGGGFFLRAARNAGYDVYGVDVDASHVEHSKPEFGERVRNVDLHDAKFADGQFDVVYMRDVFEHVPNPAAMLEEINRISRDGALLYIEVPNIEGLIYKAVGKRHAAIFGFEHLNYWSPRSLETAVGRAGYEVVAVAHKSRDFTVAGILGYYRKPRNTSVFPEKISKLRWLLVSAVYAVFRFPPIAAIDGSAMPRLADRLKRGSVLKLVARKKSAAVRNVDKSDARASI